VGTTRGVEQGILVNERVRDEISGDVMVNSTQSRFFTQLLSGLSLISMFFLFPYNAKADNVTATGVNCKTNSGIPGVDDGACVDQSYAIVDGSPLDPLYKTNLSGTAPGFLPSPAGPSGDFWVA
jgi:hypothetical protein